MRQYVSICGHSGVGKKTLIQKLLPPEGASLRQRFGLHGSIRAFGWRFEPLVRIMDADEDCLLHFWQDATNNWIADLQAAFPEHRHRVILLWRPWAIHSAALIARNNGYDPTPAQVAENWFGMRAPAFRGIEATGVEFELVDASTPNYDAILWPVA